MSLISVIVPTYDMGEHSEYFLNRCLYHISIQDFSDYEVIVTDNSKGNKLLEVVKQYDERFRYVKSKHRGGSANTNYGISLATGKIIKPLFQDDYIITKQCFSRLAGKYYEKQGGWFCFLFAQVSDGEIRETRIPYWNEEIIMGKNTISAPSAMAFLNDHKTLFDERLKWMMDVDLYHRLHQKYGAPIVIEGAMVGIEEWRGSVSNGISEKIKEKELEYIINKYNII